MSRVSSHSTEDATPPGWLLVADWERALFMHFEVPPALLQEQVPFSLDLFEGRAFVSLVAFTMRGMRLARGGRLARWLCAPLAEQRFLNLRTYVRHGDEPGIHFLAEWVSHGLCVPFGPWAYGLPYRWGRLEFRHDSERGAMRGRVAARRDGSVLAYSALAAGPADEFECCAAGTLEAFLLERYAAFTQHGRRRSVFRIWHRPWPQVRVEVTIERDELLQRFAPWWREAQPAGANHSPGVRGVWMSRPFRL